MIFTGSFPFGSVSAHRVRHLCRGLEEAGVRVEVLIPHPTEKTEKPGSGYFAGIHYQYILGISRRPESLPGRKLLDLFLHLATLVKICFDYSSHVLVIGPSLDFRIWIPLICQLKKTRAVLEINEYPFVVHEKSLASRLKRAIFLRAVVPLYDGFIAISPALDQLLKKYANRGASAIQIPVLTDARSGETSENSSPAHPPQIIHSGSVSEEKDGVLGIMKALGVIKQRGKAEFRFLITGRLSPVEKGYLEAYALEAGIAEQLVFTDFLEDNKLDNYLKNSTLAVINKYDNTQNRYCFATKLALYLHQGLPVVCTRVGATAQYLQDEHNALLVDSGDIEGLANAIERLLLEPELARKIGASGKLTCAAEFDYREQGKRLFSFLEKVAAF